jgi:hypothetical protein
MGRIGFLRCNRFLFVGVAAKVGEGWGFCAIGVQTGHVPDRLNCLVPAELGELEGHESSVRVPANQSASSGGTFLGNLYHGPHFTPGRKPTGEDHNQLRLL